MYDYLIVGSGLYGSIFAREATNKGYKVLVIDKRSHVGGNIYTEKVEGINFHKYGAHIFHTNIKEVWDYLRNYATFNCFTNSPVANYKGELYSMPFNMYTFNKMWGVVTPDEAAAKLEEQRKEIKGEPQNLEEQAISLVGRDIYEKLVKGYTEKQWGRDCKELPAFIIKQLPVRLTFDNNCSNALYQGIPIGGYTKMIEKILDEVEVRLGEDYLEKKEYWDGLAKKIVYTGPIDAYFEYKLGPLEYRSIRFENEILDIPNFQGNAAVNYTDRETPWTRIIEHKWFEFGKDEDGKELEKTIISREYSTEWKPGDEPYYPVNDEKNGELYNKYRELADKEDNVIFGGRLGEYKYCNMDATVASVLKKCKEEFTSGNEDTSYYDYVVALDRSGRNLEDLVKEANINPEVIGLSSHRILRELYTQTKLALDKKTDELTELEKFFYEKCEKELQKKELSVSFRVLSWLVISKLIDAYESIYHILPAGKEEGRVQHVLMAEGESVLPGYIGFLSTLVDTYEKLITNIAAVDILLGLSNMYDAADKAEKNYRSKVGAEDKTLAQRMLRCSGYAYSGKADDQYYRPIKASQLPESIRSMYRESNGIFSSGHGLRVWLATNGNDIVVAFSGTDVWNFIMDYEDYIQIYSASQLYLEATGLLKILLETFKTQQFYVCGHSLGGGLAQFSVTANINACNDRIKCYAYNPAGLSSNSMKHLNIKRMSKAKDFIWVYVTCKDLVSMLGAKLGHVIKLPKTESNGHGILSLKVCMDKYVNTPDRRVTDNKIKLNLYICDSNRLNCWKTAYIQSENKAVRYTMFNDYNAVGISSFSIELYENLIKAIISHDDGDSCFGVYQYVNGDAYTVFNRLSILTDEEFKPFLSREADCSIIFFGTYGNGKEQWVKKIMNLLSDAESAVDRSNLDSYYSKVANEYDVMLSAWLHLLKNTYGFDFYDYFENVPAACNNAKLMLSKYMIENKILYSKYNFERRLTKEEYKEFIGKKQKIFENFLDQVGEKALEYELMSEEKMTYVKENMKKYLNKYVQCLTK